MIPKFATADSATMDPAMYTSTTATYGTRRIDRKAAKKDRKRSTQNSIRSEASIDVPTASAVFASYGKGRNRTVTMASGAPAGFVSAVGVNSDPPVPVRRSDS